MDAFGGLLTGFGVILTPENLYLCFLGSLIGTLVGVLPGVGPLAALALLLPITFTLSPVGGMVMLASIFYGAMYGGSTTSILLNIPGEAASVVTCLDGHQMAKQGRAREGAGRAARRGGAGHRGERLLRRGYARRYRDDVLRASHRGGGHPFRTPRELCRD